MATNREQIYPTPWYEDNRVIDRLQDIWGGVAADYNGNFYIPKSDGVSRICVGHSDVYQFAVWELGDKDLAIPDTTAVLKAVSLTMVHIDPETNTAFFDLRNSTVRILESSDREPSFTSIHHVNFSLNIECEARVNGELALVPPGFKNAWTLS